MLRETYGSYWVYSLDGYYHHSYRFNPHQEEDDLLLLGVINKDEYYQLREVEALEEMSRQAGEANRRAQWESFHSSTRTSCSPNIFGGFECTTR